MSSYGSLTTFTSTGELGQIKHAQAAVNKGATALGVKVGTGVVLLAEKKSPSPLVDPSSITKVFVVDEHIGLTYSGLGPDARVLVDEARRECQNYRLRYHEPMPVGQLVRELAMIYRDYTQAASVRPFGVSLLVAGADALGPHLYQLDPSGTALAWKAVVAGKNATSTRTALEKRYKQEDSVDEALYTSLITIKEVLDSERSPEVIECGVVRDGKFRRLTDQELKDLIAETV